MFLTSFEEMDLKFATGEWSKGCVANSLQMELREKSLGPGSKRYVPTRWRKIKEIRVAVKSCDQAEKKRERARQEKDEEGEKFL